MSDTTIEALIGKTFDAVRNVDDERITFTSESGPDYMMYHDQDCCESVRVEDITGDPRS